MEYRDKYLSETRSNHETMEKSIMKLNKKLRKIEHLLCLLNNKASNMGQSISLVSRSLTNRLVELFSYESRGLQVKLSKYVIFGAKMNGNYIDNQNIHK